MLSGPDADDKVGAHEIANKISIERLSKEFTSGKLAVTALQSLDLRVGEGEFICIVGPSGCGKTTLLRILAGLETPTGGEVRIVRRGKDRPLSSMIFQENSIFPWMRVRDNVAYGLDLRGIDRARRDRTVSHFLDLTGLARFADAWPHQLSGGMKQRVSVARAFANDPEILLMDEPFAALDEQTKIVLQQELLRLWSETKKTVLFITHSIDEALVLADRVLVMSGRPGRLLADIRVDFPRPRLVHELKADAEFGRLWHRIWELLDSGRRVGGIAAA
ncbi:MAG: ABC transporter ATP-binding protein [Proteobacteria bacterium]|nr:ABC transporter ATP-binding protein [Pseudomonadota bacterium]